MTRKTYESAAYDSLALDAVIAGKEAWKAYRSSWFEQQQKRSASRSSFLVGDIRYASDHREPPRMEISLIGADLSGLDLSGYDFTKTDLRSVIANNTIFRQAEFGLPPYLTWDAATPPDLTGVVLDTAAIERQRVLARQTEAVEIYHLTNDVIEKLQRPDVLRRFYAVNKITALRDEAPFSDPEDLKARITSPVYLRERICKRFIQLCHQQNPEEGYDVVLDQLRQEEQRLQRRDFSAQETLTPGDPS